MIAGNTSIESCAVCLMACEQYLTDCIESHREDCAQACRQCAAVCKVVAEECV